MTATPTPTLLPMPTVRASYSSLLTHRECPQRWWYKYGIGLEPLGSDIAPPRDFGTWWHALRAAEAITRGLALGSLWEVPRSLRLADDLKVDIDPEAPISVQDVLEHAEQWWQRRSRDYQDQFIADIGDPLGARLEDAWEMWQERWGAAAEQEEPLLVEHRWERTLETGSLALTLFGVIDEVYLDRKRSMVVVRDSKTKNSLATTTAGDDLMDSQLHLYAWGVTPKVREHGLRVRAVAYDRIAAIGPKTPVLTKSGTLSKTVTRFDLRTYRAWCRGEDGRGQPYPGLKKDGSGAGFYVEDPAVVERLSTPAAQSQWTQRTRVPINVNVIRSHLQEAIDTAQDVERTRKRAEQRGAAPRNLAGMVCRWCDYSKLCGAQLAGGADGEYDLEEFGLQKRERRRPSR